MYTGLYEIICYKDLHLAPDMRSCRNDSTGCCDLSSLEKHLVTVETVIYSAFECAEGVAPLHPEPQSVSSSLH